MNDHPNDEDRRKLLAGDGADELAPDEAADVDLLSDLLADPSTWAQPRAGLEDAVVHAVAQAPVTSDSDAVALPRRRAATLRWRIASAAAAVSVMAAGAIALTQGGTSADFTAQLAATELVPGAHASADITRNDGGFRIVLDAAELAPLSDGQYYEAWLKNADGALVPVGTFSSSNGEITLWSGVSPTDFPAMSVTIEADDNDQSSSHRVVLAGPIRPRS